MSSKTRLYQKTGSPLIQGDSKRDVSGWNVWVKGVVAGALLTWAAWMIIVLYVDPIPGASLADAAAQAALYTILFGLPGLLLGSWAGSGLARGMGWVRPALSATVGATVLAFVSAYVGLFVLGLSFATI